MASNHISFVHTPWPNCTVALLSSDEAAPDFPGFHGTGFFIRRKKKIFLVTAGHCLVPGNHTAQEFLAKAVKVAEHLLIPVEYSTNNHKLKDEEYIKFSSVGYVVIDNSSGNFFGDQQEGNLDIAFLEVAPHDAEIMKRIELRSVTLPPTGKWFPNIMNRALQEGWQVYLNASGYPKAGTESNLDYESKLCIIQGVHLTGTYSGTGPYPHTHTLELHQAGIHYEPDGMSGGPIYIQTQNGDNPPYALAGMALRGGHGSNLIHFCGVEWLAMHFNMSGEINKTPIWLKITPCSGLIDPDTNLGENTRNKEVFDE